VRFDTLPAAAINIAYLLAAGCSLFGLMRQRRRGISVPWLAWPFCFIFFSVDQVFLPIGAITLFFAPSE
jgi:hypothetical protein